MNVPINEDIQCCTKQRCYTYVCMYLCKSMQMFIYTCTNKFNILCLNLLAAIPSRSSKMNWLTMKRVATVSG